MPVTAIDLSDFRARAARGEKPNAIVHRLFAAEPAPAADTRIVTFVFSDSSVDHYGDTLAAAGWDLASYNRNPMVLFGHDASAPGNVIGRAPNVRISGDRLIGDINFASASVNPTAETVYQMVKGGFLNAVSVGFTPLEWAFSTNPARKGGIDFKRQRLLEVSVVAVPANSNALALSRAAAPRLEREASGVEAWRRRIREERQRRFDRGFL